MDLKMGIFGWVEHHLILVDGMLLIYFGKVCFFSPRTNGLAERAAFV